MIRKNFRIFILAILIIGTLFYSFLYGMRHNMHKVLPQPLQRHDFCIAGAISELKYGLKGYKAYTRVLAELAENGITMDEKILSKYGKTNEEILRDPDIMNSAIEKALNIDNVSSAGEYYLMKSDKGSIKYYKLAFMFFGYKIESFYYFYFLLLSISVFTFIATFYRGPDLLCILLLFLLSHLAIMGSAPMENIQFATVHNTRLLPILALLPALYVGLVILGKKANTKIAIFGVSIQALIMIFIINVRPTAIYTVMFLSMLFIMTVLWFWITKPTLGMHVFKRVRFWPLAIVFAGLFILKLHLSLSMNFPYVGQDANKVIWLDFYLGLAAHPESASKYNIVYKDVASVIFVCKQLTERYSARLDLDSEGHNMARLSPDYEVHSLILRRANLYSRIGQDIMKEEFIKILKNDPNFVILSYIYKFPLFLRNYFKEYFLPLFGRKYFSFTLGLVAMIFLSPLLGSKAFLNRLQFYFFLVFLELVFSLIPAIISMPVPFTMADPALVFTFLIYIVCAGMISVLLNRVFVFNK